ncbi:P-loop NTPase fold protein [Nanoarchaeota archaeon]
MKIIYITGTWGSGKTTLEANIRKQLKAPISTPYDYVLSEDREVGFIGRTASKDNKPIKYGGLDAFLGEKKDLMYEIEKLENRRVKYTVFSGSANLKKYIPGITNSEYEIEVFFNKRNSNRITNQRVRRKDQSKNAKLTRIHVLFQQDWLSNEIKRWDKLQREYSNVKATVLKGDTKQRTQTILQSMNKPHNPKLWVVRKPYSDFYKEK